MFCALFSRGTSTLTPGPKRFVGSSKQERSFEGCLADRNSSFRLKPAVSPKATLLSKVNYIHAHGPLATS